MLIEFDPALIELAHAAMLPGAIIVILGMAIFYFGTKD